MEKLFNKKPKVKELKKFNYKIQEKDGKLYKGSIEAYNRNNAIRKLFKPGEKIVYCKQELSISFNKKTKIVKKDLVGLFDNLSFLVSSGLTLTDALEIAKENTAHYGLKKAIGEIHEKVLGGLGFSLALEQAKGIPQGTYIYQLKAGETSGNLETTFKKLAEQMARDDDFKGAVRGALTYPALMIVALIGAMAFMVIFLIPVLSEVFIEMGAELPTPTLMLLTLSDFVNNSKITMLLILIFVPTTPVILYKKTKARKYMDMAFIKMPIVGFFIKEMSYINFSSTVAMLLETGITVTEAVEISINTMGNYVMKQAVTEVRDIVRDKGRTLGQAMGDTQMFPAKLIKLSEVGVISGKLFEMLYKTSIQMEKEFRVKVTTLTKAIEPILMLLIMAVLGFVMLAMYLPMFSLMEQI